MSGFTYMREEVLTAYIHTKKYHIGAVSAQRQVDSGS